MNQPVRGARQFPPCGRSIACHSFGRAQQDASSPSRPAVASIRAVIMPSPPLLPRPHNTVTRCALGNCSRASPQPQPTPRASNSATAHQTALWSRDRRLAFPQPTALACHLCYSGNRRTEPPQSFMHKGVLYGQRRKASTSNIATSIFDLQALARQISAECRYLC